RVELQLLAAAPDQGDEAGEVAGVDDALQRGRNVRQRRLIDARERACIAVHAAISNGSAPTIARKSRPAYGAPASRRAALAGPASVRPWCYETGGQTDGAHAHDGSGRPRLRRG